MNEKGTVIDGVQICLYKNGELAAMAHSDTKGEYRTGKIPPGKYHAVASCVGLTSKDDSVMIDRDVILNFTLETKTILLDSVVVKGKRSRATSKGHIFYLSKKAKESGNPFIAL